MISLAEQVRSSIVTRRLFRRRQRILVAVSGGVDSMVLLHVLHELSQTSGWELTVAHLNHRLRGASSRADERLVRRTATGLKLPILACSADVRRFTQANGLSLEMGARKLRHDFLARLALERDIPSIALAHHLDDQIELFFLRLFRGSGTQGLAGMKWSNPSASNPAVTLVRPLLNCPKSALRQYAADREIPFREDATNKSLNIQRNRVRQELLPLLQRHYQAGIRKNVLRVMDILGAESEFVNAVAESWLERKSITLTGSQAKPSHNRPVVDPSLALLRPDFERTPFEALPVAVQRRCLQLELIRQGIVPEYDVVERLRLQPGQPIEIRRESTLPAMLSRPGARQPLDPTLVVSSVRLVHKQGIIHVSPVVTETFRDVGCNLDLREDHGELDWEGVRLAWHIIPRRGSGRSEAATRSELFDADAVGPKVVLRHWRPGDRFQPIGMARAVKLQDLFVNQKVPRESRRTLAVAATVKGELFWVEGLRMSERFKLTKSTIRRLHWAWQRL